MSASARGGKLGQTTVSPAVVGVLGAVGLLAVVAVVYFAMIKPGQDAARAAKDWVSPEAAAARAPGNRPRPANHEALLEQLRAKERGGSANAPAGRSRRRDE